MFNLGPLEVIAILVVALVVFGPNRLPEIGRQIGRAMREIRKFQSSIQDEVKGVFDVNSSNGSNTAGSSTAGSNTAAKPSGPLWQQPADKSAAAAAPAAQASAGGADEPAAPAPIPGQESLFGEPAAGAEKREPAAAEPPAAAEQAAPPDETTPR